MKNITKLLVSLSIIGLASSSSGYSACGAGDKMGTKVQDIVATAVAAGDFTTLAAALDAAGLIGTLQGDGPFTVFAPTDAAFAKLPEGTVANLLKPENKDQLVAVLTYHVVAGKVKAKDVVKLTSAKTVQGNSVSIKVNDGVVYVDDAKVVATDIEASVSSGVKTAQTYQFKNP